MYTAKNSLNEKFSSLDYFRGFAGYGVAICHYYYYIYNLKHFEYLSFFFVEFFFILSGYVLTPQIIKVYNQNKNLKIFFLRRWMRTIPLFILAVILYSILFKRFDLDTLKYFFLVQNFFPNFIEKEYISILWSLSIEEYFYLTFPILIILLSKIDINKLVKYFIITFLILNILGGFYLDSTDLRINTFLRLDSIVYGICLRLYFSFFNKKINLFILLLIITYFFFTYSRNFIEADFNKLEKILFIFNLKLLSIYFCLFFISLEKYFKRLKSFGVLIANQTYSVYLFHLMFIYFFDNYFSTSQYNIIYYFLSIFIFSTIVYNLFEKPINTLRPKFLK